MSRVVNLAMTEAEVLKHCTDKSIAVSDLEKLPDGGVRLVCKSSFDAVHIRSKLKAQVMPDEVRRAPRRPTTPLW